MTCRDIPNTSVSSYDTLQQMYVGLGIRRLPTGVHLNVDSALPTGGINLGLLTPEAIGCFDTLAGITGGSTYNATALHGNVRDIRVLIDYFRAGGNTGDANVITGEEIDAYVHAYADGLNGDERRRFNAQEYRDLTVANIAAYVSMVQYMGGGSPAVPTVPAAPAEANTAAIRSFGSVQQMYTGLVGTVAGSGAASTRNSVAEDVPADGIPLGVLNEANIQRFADAIGWDPTHDPTTPLGRNAKDILELVDYFRGDGNLDGEAGSAVITSAEIDAYVRAYVAAENANGNRTITFDNYRPIVVGNLRAIVACISHISNPPAVVPPDAGVPDGGPHVVADTTGTGGDAGARPVVNPNPGSSETSIWTWLLGGAGLLGGGALLGWFLSRRGNASNPNPNNPNPNPNPERPAKRAARAATEDRRSNPPPPSAGEVRVLSDTTGTPPAAEPRVVSNTVAGGASPDVMAELARIQSHASPAGGAPVAAGVTADSVIMPRDAAPLNALDHAVVRAQVVLAYREYFMSQAARDALLRNEPLPEGDALVNSDYRTDVNDMVETLIRQYHERGGAASLSDLWDAQRERGFIPRGGVPERLLLEICGERIARAHADGVTRFAGEFSPDAFSREATERLGNTDSFRNGLREMLRDPVRIGR